MNFVKGPNLVHLRMMKRKIREREWRIILCNKNNLQLILRTNISNHKDLKEDGHVRS